MFCFAHKAGALSPPCVMMHRSLSIFIPISHLLSFGLGGRDRNRREWGSLVASHEISEPKDSVTCTHILSCRGYFFLSFDSYKFVEAVGQQLAVHVTQDGSLS